MANYYQRFRTTDKAVGVTIGFKSFWGIREKRTKGDKGILIRVGRGFHG